MKLATLLRLLALALVLALQRGAVTADETVDGDEDPQNDFLGDFFGNSDSDTTAADLERFFDVPECELLRDIMLTCVFRNQEVCEASCSQGLSSDLNPNIADDATCADMREALCGFASCCTDCANKVASWAGCVYQNRYDEQLGNCDFNCDAASGAGTRWLASSTTTMAATTMVTLGTTMM